MISIDGMHALDVANFVKAHPESALAELSAHGVTYSNARTPANSDSFPGLLALVTGGSPLSHGVFYDYSYDRTIWAPDNKTCSGPPGTQMIFDESIDVYVNNVSQDVIDPNALPPRFRDASGRCAPMYPHNALRVNTVFEVVKSAHAGRTAWADKHPAYDLVNGPSGRGVDDLYTPEITNAPGFDNTISVVCTAQNDALKVTAVLNEIRGSIIRDQEVGVPTVFGMNFQAVSVGQKLLVNNSGGGCASDTDPHINGRPGGYLDGSGTPTRVLAYGLKKTDDALWQFIRALRSEGLYDSTLIIVTSKHGQSPINLAKLVKPGHLADLVCQVSDCTNEEAPQISSSAGSCPEGPCGWVQDDDIGLIWLPDQSKTAIVANYLNKNAPALHIDEVMSGEELRLKFRNPLHDSRTPDIIVQPVYGTVYTGASKNKVAEHGGFSFGDTTVGLIVSSPAMRQQLVKTPVLTSQVAATIRKSRSRSRMGCRRYAKKEFRYYRLRLATRIPGD